MKPILKILILILAVALVAGISFAVFRNDSNESAENIPETASSTAGNQAPQNRSVSASPVTISEQSSSTPTVSVEYPQFAALPKPFNDSIKMAVMRRLEEFRGYAQENQEARVKTSRPGDALPSLSDMTFNASWESAQINDKFVSFIIRFDSYTGGANANQDLQTFNYDILKRKEVTLSDIFGNIPDFMKKISDESRKQLVASMGTLSDGNAPISDINEGTVPLSPNFKNFTFDDTSVQIYFPKYSVGAGAFGEQKVVIPIDSI